jgi:hypothetical protein
MPSTKSGLSRSKKSKKGSKQLFTLEKNVLGKFNYHDISHKTDNQRHRALNRALANGLKPLSVFRRLNALYVLNKNQNPDLAKKLKADRDFVKDTKEYKNRVISRSKKTTKKKKVSKA